MPPKRKYQKKSGNKRQYKDINKVIDVNDVLVELKEENNRLLNELSFADKCLKLFVNFKTFVDFISIKFKLNLETNELEKYEDLSEELNQIMCNKNLNSNSMDCSSIVESEPSDDEEEDEEVFFSKNLSPNIIKLIDEVIDKLSDGNEDLLSPDNSNEQSLSPNPHINNERFIKKDKHFQKSCYKSDNVLKGLIEGQPVKQWYPLKRKADCKLFETHVKTHSKPKHVCFECHQEFKRKYELNSHMKKIHRPVVQNVDCDQPNCHFSTDSMRKLNQHLRIKHIGARKRFKCDLDKCNKEFISEVIFIRHQQKFHLNVIRIPCPHSGCEYEARTELLLNKHMSNHSTEPLFKCVLTGCDKSFKKNIRSKDRKKRHINQQRQIKCPFEGCGKVFVRNDGYSQHVANIHLKEHEYRCEWPGCEIIAYHEQTLRKHVKLTHCDYKLTCDHPGCGTMFKTATALGKHRRLVHLKLRNYPCPWPGCQFKGSSKPHLERHLLSHTKEKPFACEWPGCAFSSSQKSNVKVHMTTVHEKKLFLNK